MFHENGFFFGREIAPLLFGELRRFLGVLEYWKTRNSSDLSHLREVSRSKSQISGNFVDFNVLEFWSTRNTIEFSHSR